MGLLDEIAEERKAKSKRSMSLLEEIEFERSINDWQKLNEESSATINYYGDLIKKGSWISGEDLDKYNKAITDYIDSGNRFKQYYSAYGKYTEDDEKSWNETVKSLQDSLAVYSTFDSEDAYKAWYEDYQKQEEEQARYREMANTEQATTGWQKYLDDVAKAQATKDKEKDEMAWWEKMLGYLGNTGASDTSLPLGNMPQIIDDIRNDTSYMKPQANWSEEQRKVYGYLYEEDKNKATEYAISTNAYNDKVAEEEALLSIAKSATSSGWAGFGQTLGAIAAAPLGMADFLNDLAMGNAGRDIPEYDGVVSPFEYSQTVTSGIATHLNDKHGTLSENVPVFGGKGVGDLYGLGVSILQSTVSAYTLGGAGTLVSYFGQGAASGVDDALKRGATDWQAVLYGTMLGAFEGLAEQFSVEKLLKAGSAATFKGFFKNVFNQMVAEGQEEGLTSLASNIADQWILQDKSNFSNLVKQYMAEGMSESEAKKKACLDTLGDIAFDTIAGAASGGVSGGTHTLAQSAMYNHVAKQHGNDLINKGSVDALKALALEMTGVSQDVDSIAKKVNNKVSAKNVGKLSFELEKSIKDERHTEIENALLEKGLSKKDAKRVSEYLASNKPTKEQMAEIEGNENIKAVVTELLANPHSTINDRAFSLMTARRGVAKSTNSLKEAKSGDMAILAEVDVKDKVSKDGKTTQNSTGEAVTIDKSNPIARVDVEDGKRTVYLNTDKGEVDSDDISYASEDEGLIYESFVDLNPEFANAIIKNYDGKTPVKTYINGMREGVLLYGMHNFQGVGKDIGTGSFMASLSEADQANALRIGREYASFVATESESWIKEAVKKAEERAKESEGASKDTSTKKTAKKGTVTFEEGAKIESYKEDKAERRAEIHAKSKAVSFAKVFAKTTGINIVFYDARNTKYKAGEKANGFFDPDTDTIYLDLQNARDDKKTIAYTLSHELVHFIKKWSPTKFETLAKFLMENYASHGVNTSALLANKTADNDGDADKAFEEMIADACETMLLDSNAVVKLMELRKADLELFDKIKLHILKVLNAIRDAYKSLGYRATSDEARELLKMGDILEQMYNLFEEASVEAVGNYQAVDSLVDIEPNTDIVPVESTVKHSYKSLAKAAGFDAIEDENGNRAFIRDGKAVSKVTVEDIENSPIGAFINYSLDKKDITKEQADEQKKMFAEICTLCCKTNDFSMTMQFVGSEIFTAMKANADKQYGTTYDMPSICTKTQAVIDAMSARMVKLGRGLTTDEITAIYNEVNHAGNPVPCPECYVFSRWIGIGSLLDNIKQYQEYYGKMSVSEVAEAYKKMYSEVEASAEEMGLTFGKAKGALTKKYKDAYNNLLEKIEKKDNQGEKVDEADRKRLKELESMQNTVNAMTWIKNVYFADSALTKVNKNFKVPDEVLFDLNMGEKFATQYREAWAFRTTQGAGYGKAITPYAEVSLGEGILVTNNTSNAIKGKQNGTLNNYFLQQNGQMNADARKALDRARLKQKIQAFLGGQRFQSTSDARYENASDYLLAALEMQAMHGMVQVYTKVDGAVPAFEAWGFSTNQSLMPKNGGFDENGNVKDTSVGGMNPKVAIANRNKHEHAGTITIGVNDNHIRALFAMIERDFIIPYHASGGKADVVKAFRRIQEGKEQKGEMVQSTDYSRTQSDKVLSDDVLKWLGKTDAEIKQIYNVREARIAILTGEKPDMEVVRGNRFLSALYDKFHGGEWDGVKLAKSKVDGHIYPNEFWDKTVTYDDSGKITLDYLEYCDDLGYLHRFSGLVPSNGMLVPVKGYDENGNRVTLTDLAFKYEDGKKTNEVEDFYWKVLTDRRMYGHNGQYLPQQIVTLANTTEDTVTSFAKHNDGRQYNKELSLATAKKVASETWGNIVEEVGAENIPEATEQYTDVENTTRIKKQKKKTSDNTYENIGKELMYYEEGDLAPDLTLVETINDRTGNKEVTIKHHGQKPKDYVPKKIAYCYKLFEQHPDGTLHALFAGAKNGVPLNEWRYAQGFPRTDEGVKGMNLRERYGWHLSAGLPSAPHLMSSKYFERGYPSKGAYGHPKGSKRVWVRMAYDASTDFNSVADSTGRQNDIYGLIPFGGYYAFKENNQSEWVISSAVKIDKILTEEERQEILKGAGYDEYEAWRLKYQPTPEERAARELANKERAKAKARAKKLGTDTELAESTKAMRDAIKSRIIDNPELKSGIKKQVKKSNPSAYAPTFYSQMGRVIDGIKMDKIGAASLIPFLKGKGIKHDEIKWSGIEAFLEGKKSVTKAELQEFLAGSQLTIEEEMSGDKPWVLEKDGEDYIVKDKDGRVLDTWERTEDPEDPDLKGWYNFEVGEIVDSVEEIKRRADEDYGDGETRWGQYKLDGGDNYRELVFKMPNSTYNNRAMRVHWGEDAEGVLAHARIQDMTTADGKKMLFVEEIQSDWHNEGAKEGYGDPQKATELKLKALALDDANKDERRSLIETLTKHMEGRVDTPEAAAKTLIDFKVDDRNSNLYVHFIRKYEIPIDLVSRMNKLRKTRDEAISLHGQSYDLEQGVPDAPFRDTYHEYVMKRLIRMAAEEGYDSIGWTPSYIQSERWSEDFAEGYRIEYDQEIPSFLKKYGKKWGATVGKAEIEVAEHSVNGEHYDAENIEVWSMDITDSMEESVLYEGQVKFQKKKVSDRTILANALESTIDTSTQAGKNELKKLKEYKGTIAEIEKLEAHLAEVKGQIHDISFNKDTDRSKLNALNDEKIKTQNRISIYDKTLTRLEAMKPIKDVLEREKELVRQRTEEKGREALNAYRDKMLKVQKEQIGEARIAKSAAVAKVRETRDKQEAKQKLMKEVLDTIGWLTHPAKTDVRCPDMLKAPYKEFLDSINFDSKRALNGGALTKNDLRIDSAMNSLASVVERIRNEQISEDGEIVGFLDLPENFVNVLREMAEAIKKMMPGGYAVVTTMTSTEVKQLTRLIRTLNASIKKMNTLHANLRFANAQMLGDTTIGFLDSMGEAEKINSIKDFINWDNALPYYAFRKFGEGGESIFEELMDAQDKMAFNAKVILDFTEKSWTDEEAREWGEDTHTIALPSGASITLTTADAMGIYCLARRDNGQGISHLTGGGVRVVGLTKGSTKAKDSRANLTLVDIEEIIDSLSNRQKQVAEAIQEFMSTVSAEWGNEISMKRFLTKDFTEKVYYPIESDNENLNTELPEASQSDLYRLLNISATKALTQGANNRVVIRNIFDVFTSHTSDMARLNAYGMALLDYMKWLNYREKTVDADNGQIKTRGVRQSMNSTYGEAARKYVMNLIKDINGRAGDVGSHAWLSKMTRMAKTASVAGNARVMLLQITAYPRAAMVLSVDSLAKGLMRKPQIEKTKKYCGIALWKSFGFFDTNIARSIEDQIKGTKNIRSKLIELSMKGAEWADAITWGALWNACEYEVAKTTKNKVGSEEFYQEVGKKLREVVYATQVVDSVLTRSQLMRQKDGLTQMATAYMSEPTLTANILMDAGFQFEKAKRLGLPTKDAWKHLGRTVGVYTSVAVFTTLIESLADAIRDDDDDEEFGEKFVGALLPNMVSNVIPFNKLPIIADISDAVQSVFMGDSYYPTEIMSSQWITQSLYAINAWKSVLSGKDTPATVYDALFKSMKAISFMTGLPISNVMRDLVAMWNTIVGSIDEELKLD